MSAPWQSNLIAVPGLRKLQGDFDSWVTKSIVGFCPRAESPKQQRQLKRLLGFKVVKRRAKCAKRGKRKYLGKVLSARAC